MLLSETFRIDFLSNISYQLQLPNLVDQLGAPAIDASPFLQRHISKPPKRRKEPGVRQKVPSDPQD